MPHESTAARRSTSPQSSTPSTKDLAQRLGVSRHAVELCHALDLIDLHIDTFIPYRLWRYDIGMRHAGGPLGRRFAGHVDIPRAVDGGLTGGMFSITTNPARTKASRWKTFVANVAAFRAMIERHADRIQITTTLEQYRAARRDNKIACFPVIQGGNALDAAPDDFDSLLDEFIVRVTLVHLTNSLIGASSSPAHYVRKNKGLSLLGRELVKRLDEHRCLVDLAHIHPRGFWDAVQEHDKQLPLIVTHTGVDGVKPHWRNLDDAQIKAIADSGRTIGIIFEPVFLKPAGRANDADLVVAHMQHVIDVVGEDFVSIGSDYDGAITPPADLDGADKYPVVVQKMLDRNWSDQRIEKVLGNNALRVIGMIRP